MAHYLDFIKRYADIAIGGKHATKIGEVLLFGLLLIHNLIRQSNMVFLLLDNFTGDDECIVAENLLQEIDILLIVRRTEFFHVVKDELTPTQVCELLIVAHHVHVEVHADREVETLQTALLIKTDYGFLILAFVELLNAHGTHLQGNIANLITRTGSEAMLYNLFISAHEGAILPKHRHRHLYVFRHTNRAQTQVSSFSLRIIGFRQNGGNGGFHFFFNLRVVNAI